MIDPDEINKFLDAVAGKEDFVFVDIFSDDRVVIDGHFDYEPLKNRLIEWAKTHINYKEIVKNTIYNTTVDHIATLALTDQLIDEIVAALEAKDG